MKSAKRETCIQSIKLFLNDSGLYIQDFCVDHKYSNMYELIVKLKFEKLAKRFADSHCGYT